jgi:hypothetical protein
MRELFLVTARNPPSLPGHVLVFRVKACLKVYVPWYRPARGASRCEFPAGLL